MELNRRSLVKTAAAAGGAAEQVHLSESSAKYHRRNIYQKLGISSREELIELVNRAE